MDTVKYLIEVSGLTLHLLICLYAPDVSSMAFSSLVSNMHALITTDRCYVRG